ncbi:Leukocyte receptor cluster member 1 [Choanephora cucurbitarum]|uniref:Leukocyte receptor cluster member 1 n=1 Tax=Choanephora cucurbitarum TaxID=101091 RepID=A0A1C7N0G1_9FUNG|nr:Leukocyte receptor cluster member 1 [Choanephora cucurbitarum]
MNILHHKSWHVYNKDNVERVRQDEAKAEEEAKKKQEKVILAESEARLDLLRKRANAHLPAEQQQTVIQHVNLFQDLQENSTNDEHEAEKKAQQDKQDRQLTMYLDKGASKEDQPWYTRSKQSDEKYRDQYKFKSKQDKKEDQKYKRKRESIRLIEDPLEYISKSQKKKHKEDRKKRSEGKSKEKEKTLTMDELRAKRLERERAEQARLKSLFLDDQQEPDVLDDRKRSYNSQFNRDETFEANQKNKRSSRYRA